MKAEVLLQLDNQLCFPLYAASRMMTKLYQPLLGKLGITYPQYLIMLVLWESDCLTVNEIGKKLMLETNTLTPLLKRMEIKGIVKRTRSIKDERRVIIELTTQGVSLKKQALCIPTELLEGMPEQFSLEKINRIRTDLNNFLKVLGK
ncbi:MAG: MarR family transcriptional regulator [Gammaproteobacteria bacterium]|nr:MarR family transcriptional regulator [Gammaproteobacteria bacterium]